MHNDYKTLNFQIRFTLLQYNTSKFQYTKVFLIGPIPHPDLKEQMKFGIIEVSRL